MEGDVEPGVQASSRPGQAGGPGLRRNDGCSAVNASFKAATGGGQSDCRAQNAGTTAPLYLSAMNCFTSGLCSTAVSFFSAGLATLSVRAATKLAYGESAPS